MAPIHLKRSPVDTISRSIASPSPAPSPVTPTLVTVPSPPQVVSAESSVKAPQIKKAAQPLAPQSSLIREPNKHNTLEAMFSILSFFSLKTLTCLSPIASQA